MLRRIPGKAGDPLADKADLPIRRVLALIGEAGKVVHQGFKLAAFLVQFHPDEHVVAFELLPEAEKIFSERFAAITRKPEERFCWFLTAWKIWQTVQKKFW